MAEHTPRPWFVERHKMGYLRITSEPGTVSGVICRVDEWRDGDAYLIAASPNMLYALQCVLAGEPHAMTEVRKAIALARGPAT